MMIKKQKTNSKQKKTKRNARN